MPKIFLSLLILLPLLTFANTLGNGFVWDDRAVIVENTALSSWKYLPHLLTAEDAVSKPTGFYRPVTALSFLVDRSLWGREPFGYHLTNLLLHGAVTLLVYYVFRAFLPMNVSFLGTVIFALHPVQSETVSFLAGGRNTLLCSLFVLLSFHLYMRSRREGMHAAGWYVASLTSCLIALFSKEFAVMLPFLILTYEACCGRDGSGKAMLRVSPFFFTVILYALVKYFVLGELVHSESETGLLDRLARIPGVLFLYGRVLFFPFNLRVFYDEELPVLYGVEWWAGSVLLIVIVFFLIRGVRRDRKLLLVAGWMVLPLFPVMNIIPMEGPLVGLRFLYVAMIGFSMLLSLLLTRLIGMQGMRIPFSVVIILVVASFIFSSVQRNGEWKSDETLFSRELEANPSSPGGTVGLVSWLTDHGEFERARSLLEGSLKGESGPDTLILLGDVNVGTGQYDRAIAYYLRAGEQWTGVGIISRDKLLNKLARAHEALGDLSQAESYYKEAIRMRPEQAGYYTDMGILLVKMGDYSRSEAYLRKALSLRPTDAHAHNALGSLYQKTGDVEGAVREFRAAVALNPEFCEAYYNLGSTLDVRDPISGTAVWKQYLLVCGDRESEREWIPGVKERLSGHR